MEVTPLEKLEIRANIAVQTGFKSKHCHLSMVKYIYNNINACGRSWFLASFGHTKEYCIGICSLATSHAAIRGKSEDWLARNQRIVY
jgi:hypothetical protein